MCLFCIGIILSYAHHHLKTTMNTEQRNSIPSIKTFGLSSNTKKEDEFFSRIAVLLQRPEQQILSQECMTVQFCFENVICATRKFAITQDEEGILRFKIFGRSTRFTLQPLLNEFTQRIQESSNLEHRLLWLEMLACEGASLGRVEDSIEMMLRNLPSGYRIIFRNGRYNYSFYADSSEGIF